MGTHLIDGEFQSDKFPTTPRGLMPLSLADKTAQDLIWIYAQRRRVKDDELARDLEEGLRLKGFDPMTVDVVQRMLDTNDRRLRIAGAIALLRGDFRDDGAQGESVWLVCRAVEQLGQDRDAAMRALAHHDGRSWCAVCGMSFVDCARRKASGFECLGIRARMEFPFPWHGPVTP